MSRPTPWPVPCSKASAQPASAITVAARLVDVAGRHPGAHGRHAGRLGLGHDVEHPGQVGRRLAPDAEGAGHVGPVAVEDGAEVDDDGVARDDDAVGRPGVGLGRVGARGHDGLEGAVLGAEPAHGRVEGQGHLVLAAALAEQREHLAQGGVGDGGGAAPCGPARRRPSPAAATPPARSWARGSAGARASAQRRLAAQVTCSASRPSRLDRAALGRRRQGVALDLDAADARSTDRVEPGRGELLGRLGPVPAVGHEQRAVGRSRAGRRPNR